MTALNKQAHQTENERMAQSLAERNGEPVEGLRQRISELEEIATDYGMKFQKAQDALKYQALLHKSQLEAAENNLIDSECHVAELEEALRDKQALLEAAEKRIAELEAREVTLPPLNDDLIAILGRPNFTCSHLAELMRKSGDEIRRKSEHEQAAVIHWFLGIYLEHGDKWECVAKADIQSRVAAAGIGVKGE